MPPGGWKMPTGYKGYRHKPASAIGKQPSAHARKRRSSRICVSDSDSDVSAPVAARVPRGFPGVNTSAAGSVDAGHAADVPGHAADVHDLDAEEEDAVEGDGMVADLPLIEVSMSVSKLKLNVLPVWQKMIHRWIELNCEAGSVSLERGGRHEKLHCQVIMRLRWDPNQLDKLKAEMKEVLAVRRGDGSGCRIELHSFRDGQDWVQMVGYLFKDRTKVHFSNRSFRVTQDEIARGIAEWTAAKLSYEDDKIILNKQNFFQKVHAYHLGFVAPRSLPLTELLTDMLNTGKYVVAVSLLTTGNGPMREPAAHIFWKLILGYRLHEEEVRTLFFLYHPNSTPSQPGCFVQGQRYYDEERTQVRKPMWMHMRHAPAVVDDAESDTEWGTPLNVPPEFPNHPHSPSSQRPSFSPTPSLVLSEPEGYTIDRTGASISELRGSPRGPDEPTLRVSSSFGRRRMSRLARSDCGSAAAGSEGLFGGSALFSDASAEDAASDEDDAAFINDEVSD